MRKRLLLGLGAVFLALVVSVASAALGDHESSFDFDLASGNKQGITWDGTHFWVIYSQVDELRAYTSAGTAVPSLTFDLSGTPSPFGVTWDGTYLRVLDGSSVEGVDTYTTAGAYLSGPSFGLDASNDGPFGLTWDGTYFRVLDSDDNVYAYTNDGVYTSSEDFSLTADNSNGSGITWDGTYFRVVDTVDRKVYAYTSGGTHTSGQDFDFDTNTSDTNRGITWDGSYLRVIGYLNSQWKVFTYEGLTSGIVTNYGLGDDVEYAVAFTSTAIGYDAWKCVRSSSGQAVKVNNAAVTLHGFCAQPKDTDGMEVEIHLSTSAEYADLERLADVTGPWWMVETGPSATFDLRIYDDDPAIGFTEDRGGLVDSDRLGFNTHAKVVSDTDCSEATDGEGFACNRLNLGNLVVTSDDAVLLIGLTEDNTISSADTPDTPGSPSVSRDTDYTAATVSWELYDAVTQYEVERLTAVLLSVSDAARIEYGDPVSYMVDGTQAGVDKYLDSTIESNRTYQYRIRARGADGNSWSSWSSYVYTGAKPGVDIDPPSNIELTRDADSVMASWTAPNGNFDNYTLQRQEIILVAGSTFFANIVTLGGNSWLPASSTTYTDSSIIPAQTYEYRVAAVSDDQVGAYTDWFRVGPPLISLGGAPANFRLLDDGAPLLDYRRENWLAWDTVAGADDYEVQVSTGLKADTYIVTTPDCRWLMPDCQRRTTSAISTLDTSLYAIAAPYIQDAAMVANPAHRVVNLLAKWPIVPGDLSIYWYIVPGV